MSARVTTLRATRGVFSLGSGHEVEVLIRFEGSLTSFRPLTEATREWFAENVGAEPWQWLGGFLAVDSRYAGDLAEGIQGAGFRLGASS